jgi:hypothetical protein
MRILANNARSQSRFTVACGDELGLPFGGAWGQCRCDHAADIDVMRACEEVAARRGIQPAWVAIAWLLSKAAVTAAILGAKKVTHLEAALAAVELKLDEVGATYQGPESWLLETWHLLPISDRHAIP